MKRICHPYWLWEDYKSGFYDNLSGKEKENKIKSVLTLFNSAELTEKYMQRVVNEWKYSCEHNLSNESMNRVAYIGQAACCLYDKAPNLITMYAWKFLDLDVRERSDKIAKKIILLWEQKRKSENILILGKRKDMKTEYQTRLHLN